MRSIRPTNALLRYALALVFALVTLAYQPAMALAKSSAGHPHHATISQPAEVDHTAGGHDHSAPSEQTTICIGGACCTVVAPAAIVAPDCSTTMLGQLEPLPSRPMIAEPPDPAVPPPRLQV
jgi:hypothetical protein